MLVNSVALQLNQANKYKITGKSLKNYDNNNIAFSSWSPEQRAYHHHLKCAIVTLKEIAKRLKSLFDPFKFLRERRELRRSRGY